MSVTMVRQVVILDDSGGSKGRNFST